jgi:N-acylneuraminate cytidylyltransferase
MWVVEGEWMRPLLDDGGINPPWHSMPYQGLPAVYSQNASLEIAWSRVPLESGTIAGRKIIPFLTEGWEGFDINRPEDWLLAEVLIERRLAALPPVRPPVG